MSMQVTWLGHACLLIEMPQGNLITDPWLVDPCLYEIVVHAQEPGKSLGTLPKIDTICITHTHYDHFDPRTLQHLNKQATVIIPPSPARRLEEKLRNLGFSNIVNLPDWQQTTVRGLTITNVPSSGIPEECGFLISDGTSTIFHAADSIYWPHAKRLKKAQIDVAFLPYTGWDITGVIGINELKQWQPNWDETAQWAVSIRAKTIVPASCDQFWSPASLQWLNDRIHPGTPEAFAEAIAAHARSHPDFCSEVVVMAPGSTWSKTQEFQLAETRSGPPTLPEPLALPPGSKAVELSDVLAAAQGFVQRRRPQLFELSRKGLQYLYGVLLFLSSPYTFYLKDLDVYLRMRLWTRRGIYPVSPERVKPQTLVIELTAQDARNLFTSRIDMEMLVMAGRLKVRCTQDNPNLIFFYALEYLFVKDDYSDLLDPAEAGKTSLVIS
jgi:L-ascorbate metabolism protein UlaG (beta-lactamase superfamily)